MTLNHVEHVSVNSSPTPDGSGFIATIEVGEERAFAVNRQSGLWYAASIFLACQYAGYFTAIINQLRSIGIPSPEALAHAGDFFSDVAPPTPWTSATEEEFEASIPLRFIPAMCGRTRTGSGKVEDLPANAAFHPELRLEWEGQGIGKWNLHQAWQHAFWVLEAVTAAELDTAYLAFNKRALDVDENRIRNMIADLANHREDVINIKSSAQPGLGSPRKNQHKKKRR